MKKIVFILALLILYTPIFSQIGYEVSSIYTEKSDGGTENSQNTAYFIKNKNILKKYYAENDRIRKEIEIQVMGHFNSIVVMIINNQKIYSFYKIQFTENNTIFINDDSYVLDKESYDRFMPIH